jgi:hypothetical protein
MIYLYIKTHNITKLKYLGKTEKDPFSYTGSGKYWLRHIKKHGNDVSTQIIYQTEDLQEFRRVALEYSKKYNIVESKEWANLIEESGDGGDTSKHIDYKSRKDQSGINNPFYGKKTSVDNKHKHSLYMSGRFVGNKNPYYGKKHTSKTIFKSKLKNPTYRKVCNGKITFFSLQSAADFYNISVYKLKKKMNSNWYYLPRNDRRK